MNFYYMSAEDIQFAIFFNIKKFNKCVHTFESLHMTFSLIIHTYELDGGTNFNRK